MRLVVETEMGLSCDGRTAGPALVPAMRLLRVAGILLVALWLTGCVSDKTVVLRYARDPKLERLPSARGVTVFRFADRRGDEGDGNPRRVGGIYQGLYRVRYAKVFAASPWPEALVQDLTAALTARGVETVAMTDREYVPGTSTVSTPLALGGEIRNFSTESHWTNQGHVSGIIRLYDQQGTLLLEKRLSARMPRDSGDYQWDKQANILENMLNGAVQYFVRLVVTDPEVTRLLSSP